MKSLGVSLIQNPVALFLLLLFLVIISLIINYYYVGCHIINYIFSLLCISNVHISLFLIIFFRGSVIFTALLSM